jgi:hypothetical protein
MQLWRYEGVDDERYRLEGVSVRAGKRFQLSDDERYTWPGQLFVQKPSSISTYARPTKPSQN